MKIDEDKEIEKLALQLNDVITDYVINKIKEGHNPVDMSRIGLTSIQNLYASVLSATFKDPEPINELIDILKQKIIEYCDKENLCKK